jgi:hypothetical protein
MGEGLQAHLGLQGVTNSCGGVLGAWWGWGNRLAMDWGTWDDEMGSSSEGEEVDMGRGRRAHLGSRGFANCSVEVL